MKAAAVANSAEFGGSKPDGRTDQGSKQDTTRTVVDGTCFEDNDKLKTNPGSEADEDEEKPVALTARKIESSNVGSSVMKQVIAMDPTIISNAYHSLDLCDTPTDHVCTDRLQFRKKN